ncbi:hypothetical protein B566_EDAN010655 [Ephemera danica]|nr:hypothetical protein B566_EDAN010655 [Ephemera danica]
MKLKRVTAERKMTEKSVKKCQFCDKEDNFKGLGKVYYRTEQNIFVHEPCVVQSDGIETMAKANKGEKIFHQSDYRIKGIKAYLDYIAKIQKCEVCDKFNASIKCSYDECKKIMHLPCAKEHEHRLFCPTHYKQVEQGTAKISQENPYDEDATVVPTVQEKTKDRRNISQSAGSDTSESSGKYIIKYYIVIRVFTKDELADFHIPESVLGTEQLR